MPRLKRDLSGQALCVFLVDGIYVQARLEDETQCLFGDHRGDAGGQEGAGRARRWSARERPILARASAHLKWRGLSAGRNSPSATARSASGKPGSRCGRPRGAQRCWVHKTANILDKLPNSLHGKAKRALHEIWMAETRKRCRSRLRCLHRIYGRKYEKAVECLSKDRDRIAGLLRLPRRALEALTDHQSDRERVCDRSASDDAVEGLPLKQDRAHHDLQARPSR